MTEWEKAIAHWLPEVWTPGKKCQGGFRMVVSTVPPLDGVRKQCPHGFIAEHTIPCPPPSRDLGFRLLEVMRAAGYCVGFDEKGSNHMEVYKVDQPDAANVMVVDTDDTLEMITKAAAALALEE